jgi:hypothetical protein
MNPKKFLLTFLLLASPAAASEHDYTLYHPNAPQPKVLEAIPPEPPQTQIGGGGGGFPVTTPQVVGSGGSITTTGTGVITATHANDAVGPVINAGTLGASPALADNATAFAAVATAATAAGYVSTGGIVFHSQCSAQGNAITTLSCSLTISPGDTVLISFIDNHTSGQTIVVSDSSAVNNYNIVNQQIAGGGGASRMYGSIVGVTNAATSVTVTSSPAEIYSIAAASYSGVGAYGNAGIQPGGSSTAPSVSVVTQDANNVIVSGVGWINGATITLAANAGTVRANVGALVNMFGDAIIDNTAAGAGTSVTTSGTLSLTSPWQTQAVELRSFKIATPGVCFPPGFYNFTSGLVFPRAVTLFACSGFDTAWLCYQGTGHVMDLGPTGLSGSGAAGFYAPTFTVKDLGFTCAQKASDGIVVNSHVFAPYILSNHFLNFGNAAVTFWGIDAVNDNEDVLIKGNRVENYDGVMRQWVDIASSSTSNPRIIGNFAVCGQPGFTGACAGNNSTTTTLITVGGPTGQITDNNFAYFCPEILLLPGSFSTRITNNLFETPTNGLCAVIKYQTGVDGLKIEDNYADVNGVQFLLGPTDTFQTIQNVLVSRNHIVVAPTNLEVVRQNNLVGQTGNLASMNMCATALVAASSPCPLLHTTGANITQWNSDYAGTCTMAAGVCPTYTFQTTYSVAPKCTASWTGAGVFTGVLQVIPTTTTLIVKDLIGTDTGVMNWSCSPDAQ